MSSCCFGHSLATPVLPRSLDKPAVGHAFADMWCLTLLSPRLTGSPSLLHDVLSKFVALRDLFVTYFVLLETSFSESVGATSLPNLALML